MANTYTWQANPTVDAYIEYADYSDTVYCVH